MTVITMNDNERLERLDALIRRRAARNPYLRKLLGTAKYNQAK